MWVEDEVAPYASLQIDPVENVPHIAYVNFNRTDVRIVMCNDEHCNDPESFTFVKNQTDIRSQC